MAGVWFTVARVVEVPGPCVIHVVAVPRFPRAARQGTSQWSSTFQASFAAVPSTKAGQEPRPEAGVEKGLCLLTGAAGGHITKGRGMGGEGLCGRSHGLSPRRRQRFASPRGLWEGFPDAGTSELGVSKGRVTSALTGTAGPGRDHASPRFHTAYKINPHGAGSLFTGELWGVHPEPLCVPILQGLPDC